MNYQQRGAHHTRFYNATKARIESTYRLPDDLCFIYVQHAFSPLINYLGCVENRVAAVILKGSSAKGNPEVVEKLKTMFPGRILPKVSRNHLNDVSYTLQLLKDTTLGRPFAILEYGGYFAPAAEAISNDRYLGPKLAGFVEGTENGIRGSADGTTMGYQHIAKRVSRPIISKAKSGIKKVMDLEIGPAIVRSSNDILQRNREHPLERWQGSIGVLGIGSIGRGVLTRLENMKTEPMVFDADLSVMAEMANRHYQVVSQQHILSRSDIMFLNTGSCFLAQQPELLKHVKDNALLVLCTSGDVEAGIPQLHAAGHIALEEKKSHEEIAVYRTRYHKYIRVMLGRDKVGQAPNMIVEDGSGSAANLMSDMEFYALGAYLGSNRNSLPTGGVSDSPQEIQNIIIEQWLQEFYPSCLPTTATPAPEFISSAKPGKRKSLDSAGSVECVGGG